jgi:ribosomal protein S12 methylthiotransferase accessory factor
MPGLRGPVPKASRAGTPRQVRAEETVARLRPLLPLLGITRVANVTGLDRIGIPVVMVCRPNSRSLAVSQGKGLSLAEAKASGLMESIEAYHAERITLPLKLASYAEMQAGHPLADVNELNRPKISGFHRDLPILWVEGYDLLNHEPAWVPHELVHTNYTYPLPAGSGCFARTSNGLASGNHLLEAVSHGISEGVESDAVTLWALAGKAARDATRIDLASVEDPGCRWVLDRFARAGMGVGVWETTSDVGIPCFLCRIWERGDGPRPALGYGCHPARRVALFRALTEAAQSRLTDIAGSRDDIAWSDYERSVRPDGRAEEPDVNRPDPGRGFADGPDWTAETFDEDVSWQLERLRSVGVERVVVVDLTKPELGIPVVRVVIPGLEVAHLGPGLYGLGRRARAVIARRS